MHLFDRERHFFGGTGIVGAGIPIGTGIAQAIKYRGGDQICLCFFGDGAVNTGAFHESINIAALWKLPVIYICENNQYAMGTSVSRASSFTELVQRSEGYNVKRERVDGMDFFAVRELAERLIADVRENQQPYFVEAVCYRYRGHGAADPGTYRTREEVAEWRERDPIGRVERYLVEQQMLTEEDVERMHQQVTRPALSMNRSSRPPSGPRRRAEQRCQRSCFARPSARRSSRRWSAIPRSS